MSLLEVKNLTVHYVTHDGTFKAVNDVSFSIEKGETMGLVGETGAGKTTTALSIMKLIPDPPGKIINGSIVYEGKNVFEMTQMELQGMRGGQVSMIFQDPMTALNPVIRVGDQIAEVIGLHQDCSKLMAKRLAREMLETVGIPGNRADDYPHQFSGGMKQRVIIAIALACNPELLIADEPTTALDVTIQAQILQMIQRMKQERGISMLLITHDLGIVAETCDKVAIMYAGEIVEYGSIYDVFDDHRHPYTAGLFDSLPSLDKKVHRLKPISGLMPDPANLPEGCKFHPRCPMAVQLCTEQEPPVVELSDGHYCRCHMLSDQWNSVGVCREGADWNA